MAFQWNGKMRIGSKKTSPEKIGIPLQSENVKLHRMHQTVEQGTFDDEVVEHDHVHKRERRHMGNRRKVVDADHLRLHVEGRWSHPVPVQLDRSDAIENTFGEERFEFSLRAVRQGDTSLTVSLAFFPEIVAHGPDCVP